MFDSDERRRQHDLDHQFELLRRKLFNWRDVLKTRVVDQDVESTELLDRLLQDGFDLCFIGDV